MLSAGPLAAWPLGLLTTSEWSQGARCPCSEQPGQGCAYLAKCQVLYCGTCEACVTADTAFIAFLGGAAGSVPSFPVRSYPTVPRPLMWTGHLDQQSRPTAKTKGGKVSKEKWECLSLQKGSKMGSHGLPVLFPPL